MPTNAITSEDLTITVQTGNAELPTAYATISIAYRVEAVFHVDLLEGGLGGIVLREGKIDPPYWKDYDALETPAHWGRQFDVRRWGVLLAMSGGRHVGGATVAYDTPEVNMLAGRVDLAVLWDIRVHPDWRGRGVGTLLFDRAAAWSRARGCRQLKIETQNINVPACRFYAARGCQLGEINRHAYAADPRVAHEVMLVWYLDL